MKYLVRFKTLWLQVSLFVFSICVAHGSSEVIPAYDARSAGMGGTGSAYLDSSASIFHNPAQLDRIKDYSISIDLVPLITTYTVPLDGPNTSVTSDADVFPLAFVGAARRFSDNVTLGVGIYPIAGYGSGYSDVFSLGGRDLRFGIVAAEAASAAAVRLSKQWSLGLAYRITYVYQTSESPVSDRGTSKTSLDGANFFGLHAGLTHQLDENLALSLTFRTGVTTSISGDTEISGNKIPTRSQFATPPALKLGAAFRIPEGRLLLAADAKYLFYQGSNKQIESALSTPAGEQIIITRLNWHDVASLSSGIEYLFPSEIALRAGYFISGSATPESTAGYFTPPPGLIHSITLGSGFKSGHWEFDFAGVYTTLPGAEATPTEANPPNNPGRYSARNILASLSATFRPGGP